MTSSMLFEVLAEPHRRQIVDLLRRHDLAVGEIVAATGLSQPAVSKHLRVLKDAGLVDSRIDAQRRLYSLRPEPFRELDAWLAGYRSLWEERLDRLETYLQSVQHEALSHVQDEERPNE